MTRVHIQDLGIRFGNHDVIKGLDLDVRSGEFLVLLGPSGCGKSTLLHTIAGLNPVSHGSIHIGEQDMTRAEPSQRGVYAGAVGYISATGELDTCIALRTSVVKDGKLYVQAGAGVVADSVPAMEQAECEHKSAALFRAAQEAIRVARSSDNN